MFGTRLTWQKSNSSFYLIHPWHWESREDTKLRDLESPLLTPQFDPTPHVRCRVLSMSILHDLWLVPLWTQVTLASSFGLPLMERE